jgi:hypothetical protein
MSNTLIILVGADLDETQLKETCDAFSNEGDISNVMIDAKTSHLYEYSGYDKDTNLYTDIKIIGSNPMPTKLKWALDKHMKEQINAFELILYITYQVVANVEEKIEIDDILDCFNSGTSNVTGSVWPDYKYFERAMKYIKKKSPNYIK